MLHFALCVLCMASLSAGSATANEAGSVARNSGQRIQRVTFDNAELSNERHVETVYNRLRSVAEVVCEVDGAAPIWVLAEDRACMDRAISAAVRELDSPPLNRLHGARSQTARARGQKQY